jgi:hypothetical protein
LLGAKSPQVVSQRLDAYLQRSNGLPWDDEKVNKFLRIGVSFEKMAEMQSHAVLGYPQK